MWFLTLSQEEITASPWQEMILEEDILIPFIPFRDQMGVKLSADTGRSQPHQLSSKMNTLWSALWREGCFPFEMASTNPWKRLCLPPLASSQRVGKLAADSLGFHEPCSFDQSRKPGEGSPWVTNP